MGEFFLYPIIFATVGWAARLAKAKGRNPWIWGGAAVLLGLLHVPQSALLSVIPVSVLIFTRNPSSSSAIEGNDPVCARCTKPHSDGQHFCTGCGWDLSQAYIPEVVDPIQQPTAQPPVQTTMTDPSETSPNETPAPALLENTNTVTDIPPEDKDEAFLGTAQPESESPASGPVTEHVPLGTYDPGPAPTAAVMVARGMERFQEQKYQESIDQFTKAIALDPNYAEAWEKRAEAYAQMGRSQQAEEDRRHLQALAPRTLPG